MITVPQIVSEIVNDSPYLTDGLSRGLINISALARELRPQVETTLMKRVSQAAVVMALKRYEPHNHTSLQQKHPREYFSDLSIKSDLSAFTVRNTPKVSEQIAALQEEGWRGQTAFITTTKGVWDSTIVISNSLLPALRKNLGNANYTYEYDNIAAITLRFHDDHHETVGLIQYPLQLLAWRGISLYQIATTMDEVNFIMAQTDVERGFQALKQLIE